MKHDDWLYLLEFFMKRNDVETAQTIVAAMKNSDEINKIQLP